MTSYHEVFVDNLNLRTIQKIASEIEKGALLIYPTDTVYAIGCLSTKMKPLERLAKIKGVKLEKTNFSFLFQDISELSNYVKHFDVSTFRLLKDKLPGPYTFIMPVNKKLPKPFDKRKSIGIRISNHPVLEQLLPLLSAPLITTSLHDKDEILDYTTDPQVIYEEWEDKVDIILATEVGGNTPSTVIDLSSSEIKVLREGKGEIDFL